MSNTCINHILKWREKNPGWNVKRLEAVSKSQKMKLAAIRVAQNPEYIKKRSETMRNHPKMRRGTQHPASKEWHLTSPSGMKYSFINLDNFIRQNPHLFVDTDVEWRKTGVGVRTLCRAYSGLSAVRCGAVGTWKGWTWSKTYLETK